MNNHLSDCILLDHGAGGRLSRELTETVFLPAFSNSLLARLEDGAVLENIPGRLAFSTDSYVVDPIFFPGGDIGDLAVNGTVNDLSMCGATPLYLSVGMIIEEGLSISALKRIVRSMAAAAGRAGVTVVTGDTKVVPRGAADKIFINTSGIGVIPEEVRLGADRVRPGDRIVLSGTMADHGVAVLSRRGGLELKTAAKSDTAPLNRMTAGMLKTPEAVHALRDPTRGGVGTTLCEIAEQSGLGFRIHEARLPVKNDVAGVCELLGFDPLYLANEGKLLAFTAPDATRRILEIMRNDPAGKDACIIGETVSDHPGKVVLKTAIGGSRIVDMLSGEQLPRIC